MMHFAPELVYDAPVKYALLTWSDAGTSGPKPTHHIQRPASDRGPVMRLLEVGPEEGQPRYDAIWILSIPSGEKPASLLVEQARAHAKDVRLLVADVDDPSDYEKLFRALGQLMKVVEKYLSNASFKLDVLLSAGTPQAQTLWVILVKAGMLKARMLQVIPPAFVPLAHPRAVREVVLDIEGFPEIRALRREVQRLRAAAHLRANTIIGQSEPMKLLSSRIARIAATDVPVLVLGETGTGKELVARAVHEASPRAKGPFVAENCSVFAEGVLSSELFGHEAGAFTGAKNQRRGVFEQASGGTLLLDEVGEMPLKVQAALLRVLQEGTLRRVGGESLSRVDVRVIAATHRDLQAMVRAGSFREDLYYRLRGATLEVPALRTRPSDLGALIDAFLKEARPGKEGAALQISREVMRILSRYPWPGNVRELRAEVLRWAVFCDDRVDVEDLSPEILDFSRGISHADHDSIEPNSDENEIPSKIIQPLSYYVSEAEKKALRQALGMHSGNLSRTARALGIDRNTLKRKMGAYALPSEEAPDAGDESDEGDLGASKRPKRRIKPSQPRPK